MQDQWIRLKNKYTSKCIQCGEWINQGEMVLWFKGLGIKHEECPTGLQDDNSALVVIDNEDKEMLGIG